MRIFENITNKFHIRFKNRQSAGNILGESLKDLIKKEDRKNCMVFGIPRGGVITGYHIAKKLGSRFDILMSRKLCAPNNEELAIGAVTADGTTYLNYELIKDLDIQPEYIVAEKLRQLREIERRSCAYYSENKANYFGSYSGLYKIVILADDGASTGATLIAAKRCIMQSAGSIIIATPVAPRSTVNLFKTEGMTNIEIITISRDSEFKSVEQYYNDFHQLTDEEVIEFI